MFVINANQSGGASATAYATGWGGNSAVTSASGYYDIPMNGSAYNMFFEHGCCSLSCSDTRNVYDITTNTYTWWNWNNPNEESLVECGKVKAFDVDVLYPNNMNCSSIGPAIQPVIDITADTPFGEHELDTVVEIDLWETQKVIPYVMASRKKFCWWEKVWRTITAFLSIWKWVNKTNSCSLEMWCYCKCTSCTWSLGRTSYALKCPSTAYIDLWVLHSDGTKTVLAHRETHWHYYNCLYKVWSQLVRDEVWDQCFREQVFNWEVNTEWVIACKWDRTYFEFGVCPQCLLYDVYTKTRSCSTGSQDYWKICSCSASWTSAAASGYVSNQNWFFFSASNEHREKKHIFGTSECYRDCIFSCTINDDNRFNWIQFSIE